MSAAHVFVESETTPDTVELNGQTVVNYHETSSKITESNRIQLVFKGQKIKVKSITLHPNYLDSLFNGSCDIALLELDEAVINISPAKVNTRFDELNSNVVGVGYGASGSADSLDLVNLYNKKIAGENVIDSIGGQKYLGLETKLICDFDHPNNKEYNKLGSPRPRALEYISSGGDSGGGLFRKKSNNKWELVGICAGGGIDVQQLLKFRNYYGSHLKF